MARNRGPQTNSHRDKPAKDHVSEPGGGPSVHRQLEPRLMAGTPVRDPEPEAPSRSHPDCRPAETVR